ncbi:hypothetical protein CBL_03239 [Carabus blaptoides fortunei]
MDSNHVSTQSWLTKQLDKFFATNNGYNRLYSVRFSRSCKSFSQKPTDDDSDNYEVQIMENQKKISVIKSPTSTKQQCNMNNVFNNNVSVKSDKVMVFKNQKNSYEFRSLRGSNKKRDNRPVLPAVLMTFDKGVSSSMDKDLTELPDMESNMPMTKEELLAFERRHTEYLCELERKRVLLDENRQQLAEMKMQGQYVERQLINESRKNENDNLQFKLLKNATETLEGERRNMITELNKLKTEVEIVTAERDDLKKQTRDLYIDNIKCNRKLEELTSQHRCHEQFQKDIVGYHARMEKSVAQIRTAMNTVSITRTKLFKCKKSLDKCTKALLAAKHMEEERDKAIETQDSLELEVIRLTAELELLQQKMSNSPVPKIRAMHNKKIKKLHDNIQHLENQLSNEVKSTSELTQALASSEKLQKMMAEKEKKQEATIAELTKKLTDMEVKEKVNSSGRTHLRTGHDEFDRKMADFFKPLVQTVVPLRK